MLEDIRKHLALCIDSNDSIELPPMLLLGEPGIGKTHFARKLAELLGTGFGFVPMSSLTAGWVLSGASSQWKNAKPGKVFDTFLNGDYANPVIVVDELDKASADGQYDPLGALYELLEIETATRFVDEFVELPIDASGAVWLATANDAARIPEPLLNRLAVYEIERARRGRRARASRRPSTARSATRTTGARQFPGDAGGVGAGEARLAWRRARCAAPSSRRSATPSSPAAARCSPTTSRSARRAPPEDRLLEVGEQPPAGDHARPDHERSAPATRAEGGGRAAAHLLASPTHPRCGNVMAWNSRRVERPPP